jgi:hypothetical protein
MPSAKPGPSRELLAILASLPIAVVAGFIGGGAFYLAVGYFRGEEEALGGGYQAAAGVAAVIVAVVAFWLARDSLRTRFARRAALESQSPESLPQEASAGAASFGEATADSTERAEADDRPSS